MSFTAISVKQLGARCKAGAECLGARKVPDGQEVFPPQMLSSSSVLRHGLVSPSLPSCSYRGACRVRIGLIRGLAEGRCQGKDSSQARFSRGVSPSDDEDHRAPS